MRKRGNLPGSQGLVDEQAISRVQVYVRIRPLGQSDVRNAERKGAVSVEDEDVSQLHVVDGKKEKKFQFDHVLSPDSTNEEVYQVVGKPLVEASMTGLNSILMAYGQTGAGKTHTLMASDGLTTSVVSHVFRLISKDSAHSYAVSCSYLQIYQERVYDLLAPDKSGPEVFLREHPKKGVYVENLSEYFVKSPEEIGRLLKSGKKKLAIAETKMNRQSSRSHAVCLLKIERLSVPRRYGGIADSSSSYESSYMSGTSDAEFSSDSGSMEAFGSYHCSEDDELLERITTQTRGLAAIRGKLYVCDLAGSERVKKTKAEGERLQEAQSINSSLLALGNVIQALAEGKKRHIPYRNSTLTRLLQDGLDGNSKTSLIVCVSPSVRDVNETLCSLKFGLRAMKVHNVTHVNVKVDYEKMAKQLSESLEGKEREWRRQKSEYESYIMALEAERDSRSKHEPEKQVISSSRETTEKTHFPVTLEEVALKNQTKAVLLAELVSMELFYGLEDLLRIGDTGLAEGLTSSKLYNLTDKDLLLHSAETLLELTEYFFAKSTLSEEESGRNPAVKKLDSEGKTERPSRLLAQGHGELLGGVSKGESSYERKLFRVRETLCRLKRTTDSASLGFLSRLLDAKFDESEKGLQEYKKRLYELLKHLVETQTSCSGVETTEEIDPLKLEQSLCHVLMDKALLNCLLLLDKADMESRIKTVDVQTFDYTGLSSATPVQCDCSSQSSDDFGPSSPLSGARNLDVRLTSVDEGVVLESSSESANSREKLAAHLENTMEELEGENKRLYEKNEELRKRCEQSENENSELSIKLVEYETKLERGERKLSLSGKTRLENTAVEVQDKMEEREFEACVLSARMEDLEYKLKTKDKTISVLKQNEKMLRGQVFEQRKRTEDVEEQNAKLQLKVKQAEEKFEQSELKLASYTGSEMLESRKITKQLESLIVENKELALKILKLEEEKSKVRDQNDGENKADFSEDQKKMLERKIINLEVKLKDQEVKILSVKEYERRIRAELCKEMTKKLTKAQTQSRQLGEKIFELESKLREAEQQYSTVRGMDTSARSAMRDGIKSLTDKLRAAECRNRELSGFVQDAEERLLLSQRKVLAAKQAEIDMREKVQLLELENCRIKERTNIRKEEKIIRPSTGRTADRLEKLRKENSNLSLELKCFRENILKLERDLLKKDEEILTLRNDSVDLSSEVCKLRSELDESNKCKNELKKKITTCSEAEQKLVARLAIVQEELNKLETSKAMQVEQAANGDWSASSESTLLIGEVNFEDPAKSVDSSTFLEETSNDEMVKESQMHDSDIAHELDELQVVIDKLRLENLRVTEKNEILEREMKSLEEKLSVVEKAFQACRSENECLLREVNLKSSKAITEGTHASFCTEKAGELRSEIGAQRQSEISLEKRLADLENESICMREEIGHGMLEFTELREKKGSLEKKVSEASLVVDHLKKEILDLINGLLTLQRNLNLYVDKMLACLGLEETSLQPFRVGLINGSSTPTEESSSDASSEISETFSWKSAFSFRLLPDKEGFLNPSDVSTIRESKVEIIRVHEDLKAKILAIKDALSRLPIHAGDENVEAESELDGKTNEFGANLLVDTSKSGSVLPRLCRAERVKLSSLLSRLKEELVRERKTSNDGPSEGNDLCTLYDNLESKLSRLSCELALREDEITILVTQRKKLQDELEECEKGLIICCHCASKIPNQIEENRQQLKGKLLSHIEDTSWLESEIWGFMEYRQKLESELDKIKGKIINMEDELDVRKILIKRCTTVRPEGDERDVSNSDSSKEDTDDFRPSLPGKKRKSQKHVTFENVDISESEDKLTNKRRRQKSDTVDNDQSGHVRSSPDDWLEADMDSSDVDLCELLASIPRDIPKKPPSPEELEIAEIANRLSGYDNMSFDDKLQYATLSRKTEQDLEYTTDCKGVLSNGNNSHSKTTHDEVVEGDDAERITCQMCGLFRKRS